MALSLLAWQKSEMFTLHVGSNTIPKALELGRQTRTGAVSTTIYPKHLQASVAIVRRLPKERLTISVQRVASLSRCTIGPIGFIPVTNVIKLKASRGHPRVMSTPVQSVNWIDLNGTHFRYSNGDDSS